MLDRDIEYLDMGKTSILPHELNYDHYENEKYDHDIVCVIPGYTELHTKIQEIVLAFSGERKIQHILELGIGTGLTSEKILSVCDQAQLCGVDFSEQMMKGAKKRLQNFPVEYLLGDYAHMDFDPKYDIVLSVIGMHHQSDVGKKEMFQKIFGALVPGGIFVLGDLVTYQDTKKAAFNEAKHFHHLVSHASDEKTLQDWAYHHKYLNRLAPMEAQQRWMEEVGFLGVRVEFEYFNTALLVGCKN